MQFEPPPGLRREAQALLAAVDAAREVLAADTGTRQITSKGGRDLVTEHDVAVEDAIRRVLRQRYPSYAVVGEERGGAPAAGYPYWLVDPICGTRAFASGVPLFCTNIALVEADQVVLAAVAETADGPVDVAERAGGAWRCDSGGWTALQVSGAGTVLCVDANGTRVGPWTPQAGRFTALALLSDRWSVWMLPTSLSYAYLAAGRIAGLVHFGVQSPPVHTAAGCLLAGEAGAVVTDIDGAPWTLRSDGFAIAASAALHRDLLDLIVEARSP